MNTKAKIFSLVAMCAFAALSVGSAAADTCSVQGCTAKGNLLISGTVPIVCSLIVKPTVDATKLDILGGASAKLVATVNEVTNNLNGYKVTMSSVNAGKLVHGSLPSQKVAYQLSYNGGAPISPTTAPQLVKNSGPLLAPANANSDVKVTFPGAPASMSGTYSDTVTFEMAAL